MRRTATWLALFVISVLAPYSLASAAYNVSVDVGPPKTAKPGDLVTHVFTIENTGTDIDQYNLKLTLPTGWGALPTPSQVSLAVGETKPVFLTMIVPGGATEGTYGAILRATSVGDPGVWAEAEGIIELVPTAGLVLEVFQTSRAPPGAEAQHIFRIRNTGNVVDTYWIDVRIGKDWTMRLSQAEVQVLPGSQAEFTVMILIPRTVHPGTKYNLWVKVTSSVDSIATETLLVTLTVAPPLPGEVRTELYPELPLTATFRITEAGEPTLGLSLIGELPGIGKLKATRSLGLLGVYDQSAGFYTSELGVDWGDVSLSGAFTELSGEGLRFLWDGTGIGGTELLLTDVGKGFSGTLDWEEGSLRLVLVGMETTPYYTVNEIQFTGELSETLSLAAILADACSQSGSASAFHVKPSISSDLVSGYLGFGKVSPYFPEKAESATFNCGFSFANERSPVTAGLSTGWTTTLTDPGPPRVFTSIESFQATVSFSPNPRMSFDLDLKLEGKHSDDTTKTTEEGSSTVGLGFTQAINRTHFTLNTSFKRAWNNVANTDFSIMGLGFSARMPLGGIPLSGTVSVEQIQDLLTNTTSERRSSFSLSASFPQSPLTPTINLAVSNGEASVSSTLSWVNVAGWKLDVSFQISLIGEVDFSTKLELTYPLMVTFFGPTYGLINGRAFIDANKNGDFDPGERGVPDLLLSANGQQAITGRDGRFIFSALIPGLYLVEIDGIPFGLSPLGVLPAKVTVRAGQQVEMLLPLEQKSLISGYVFHDFNQNGVRDAGETGVGGVQVLVTNTSFRERTTADGGGRFSVEVDPRDYTVELVVASLPERFEPTTPTKVRVLVEERALVRVEFGAWQCPRPVIFGPQGPIAHYDCSPTAPRAGEEVNFDASTSQAFDGGIVSYEWEFRKGMRVMWASGKKVTIVFKEAGTWLVTLKVTDSNRRTGQSQKMVQVR